MPLLAVATGLALNAFTEPLLTESDARLIGTAGPSTITFSTMITVTKTP